MTFYYKFKFQTYDLLNFENLELIINKTFNDQFKKQIKDNYNLTFKLLGPIRFPQKKSLYTVNKSHHVNKKSRDQFQLLTHSSMYIIKTKMNVNLSPEKRNMMEQILKINILKITNELKKNSSISMNIKSTQIQPKIEE